MVHNNKVLTVSYGTFSCTLEGFDDSFGTMKAIAEYFRGLAADDRYFGAEPPQPDAELLARIAQKEITRRVEAHADGTAIVLKAQDPEAAQIQAAAPVAEPPAAPAEEMAEQAADPVATETATEEPGTQELVTDAVTAEVLDPETPAQPASGDSIAAKLQRIRNVVARDNALVTSDSSDLSQAFADAETVEGPATDPLAELQKDMREDEDTGDDLAETALADSATDTAQDTPEAAPMPEVLTMPEEPAQDTLAEMAADSDDLDQAIADILPETDATNAPTVAEVQEDAPAEPLVEALVADQAETPVETPVETLAEETLAEETQEEPREEAPQDSLATPVETAPAPTEPRADRPETRPFDLAAFEAVTAAIHDSDTAEAEDEDDVDFDAVADSADPFDFAEEADASGDDTIFAGIDDSEDESAEFESELTNILSEDGAASAAPQASAPRGRVIKVKRTDLEAAVARGAFEDMDEDDADQEAGQNTGQNAGQNAGQLDPSTLSPEDEADLMRELSDIAAELSEPAAPAPDADMPRLLAEAGQKMNEEESASNRETYAQLRAAVAATKAEVEASGEPKLLALDEQYRDDLASVVRPDRPTTRPSTRARPAPTAAPLKLVAEQRVDETLETAPRAPVRPRRVTTALLEDGASDKPDTEGFGTFAKEVGANSLPELLEAAASYLSYVEGREKFSRPQLMTKVRQVEKEQFNREDGLRSFGQLLREGKIAKAGGGRFTASPDIGFQPDQRAAG